MFAAWKVNALVASKNPARAWTWAALAHLVTQFGREHSCDAFVDWFDFPCLCACTEASGRRTPAFAPLLVSLSRFTRRAMAIMSILPHGHKWSGGAWMFDTSAEASALGCSASVWSERRPPLFAPLPSSVPCRAANSASDSSKVDAMDN